MILIIILKIKLLFKIKLLVKSMVMEIFLKDTLLKKEDKKISIWTANQVYIALSHLLTFCPSLGIDSCPIEGFESHKYNDILKLNDRNLNSTVVAAVVIGQIKIYLNMKKR